VLDIPEIDIQVEVERWEFEAMIAPLLFEFEQAIAKILDKAGYQARDIDLVLRTGGSSLIPAVKDILDNGLPARWWSTTPLPVWRQVLP